MKLVSARSKRGMGIGLFTLFVHVTTPRVVNVWLALLGP